MLTYLVRRLLLLVPTLLGVLAVVFFVMAFAPGGFGGSELSAEGSQTEGQDAQRIRRQLERRYGLDQPRVVQFGRWLNQVSPVGFRMSSDLRFGRYGRGPGDDAAVAALREEAGAVLADQPFNTRPSRLDRAVDLVDALSAYADVSPAEAAQRLDAALDRPSEGLAVFELLDVDLDEEPEGGGPTPRHRLRVELAELERDDLGRAQLAFLRELGLEAAGRSRVRFDTFGFKTPDLGTSLRGTPVVDLLARTVPTSLLLNALSVPLIYAVAIVSGIYAARRRGGWFDVSSGGLFLALWSVPTIWAGVLLITYFANTQYFRWFPSAGLHDLQAASMPFLPRWSGGGFERGWLLDTLWHLVLPVLCMTYAGFAVMSKVMRGAMLENLGADFVRTARAKGVSEHVVLWRHAFRNSVLPLITMVSGVLPALFAGTVVVETIFSINGLGRLGVEAAFQKDFEVVMATTLIGAVLGLSAELIRDLCYALADPRVSYD